MKTFPFKFFLVCFLILSCKVYSQTDIDFKNEFFFYKQETLDKLERLNRPDEAILYLFRAKAFTGAMVKWGVDINGEKANISKEQYIIIHLDPKGKNLLTIPHGQFNLINMAPGGYYYIELVGGKLAYNTLNLFHIDNIESATKNTVIDVAQTANIPAKSKDPDSLMIKKPVENSTQ